MDTLKGFRSEFKGIYWPFAIVLLVTALILLVYLPGTAKGTALASIVALFVALIAYPWQKECDRVLKVADEKRAAYKSFFEASETFFAKLRTAAFKEGIELPDEEFSKLEAAKSELAFHGGSAGVLACAELAQNLKDYRNKVKLCRDSSATKETKAARDSAYNRVNDSRIEAIVKAREDAGVFDINTSASDDDIRCLFLLGQRRSDNT